MKDRLTVAFCIIASFGLIVALGIVTNPAGYHQLMTEGHKALLEIAHAAWTGVILLFWTVLILGAASVIVFLIKQHREIGAKGQPLQAVIYKGELVQLTQAMGDPAQQLKVIEEVLRIGSTAAMMTKRMQPYLIDTVEAEKPKEIAPPREQELPQLVRYEDVAPQVPKDHALVGIGAQGIVTRLRAIKALIWIVGGSGSGKTNSACLRIEEDYTYGHYFLVIDPHWFKDDSLWNAIKGYQDRFLVPVKGAERPFASETEDIIAWLDYFINEFKRRKAGGSWQYPITIVIDEIGSLVTDKTDDPQEQEMREKIKIVTRICGQESRNFEMTGMCISQDAAGLAWLRKRAIMVIAHQLLMMSERILACNENAEIARSMDDWPIGRALIYGIGFKEGQRVYQQPVVKPRVVESLPPRKDVAFYNNPTLPLKEQQAEHRYTRRDTGPLSPSTAYRFAPSVSPSETPHELYAVEGALEGESKGLSLDELTELEKKIGEMFFAQDMNPNAIVKELWPDVQGGTAYQQKAAIVASAIRKVGLR